MQVLDNRPVDRLDRSLRDLRISVTDRCNFRCTYCMPEEKYHRHFKFLTTDERLDFEEILRLTRLFAIAGVRKLRITGGEPLLRPALGDLIGDLRELPGIEEIALTTNGILLAQHAAEHARLTDPDAPDAHTNRCFSAVIACTVTAI